MKSRLMLVLALVVAILAIGAGSASALTYSWSEQVARLNARDEVYDKYPDGGIVSTTLNENHIEQYCGYFVPCVWEFKYTVVTQNYINAVQVFVAGCPAKNYADGCASYITRTIYYRAHR